MECCFASLNHGLTELSNGLASIVIDIHEHPPTSFTAETFSPCLSWLRSPSPHYRKSPCIRPLEITPTLRVHAQSGEVNTFVLKYRPCPCIRPGMPATPVHVQVLIPNTYGYPYSKYTPFSKITPVPLYTPRKSRLLFYTPGGLYTGFYGMLFL